MISEEFRPSGFAVVRTPLLSFQEFVHLGSDACSPSAIHDPSKLPAAITADRQLGTSHLLDLVKREDIQEALFIASPDFAGQVTRWAGITPEKRSQKVAASLMRYVARMAGRTTPFGLFAASSLAEIGDVTAIETTAFSPIRRRTRLDSGYLHDLAKKIADESSNICLVLLHPNSSLYISGGRWHYVASRQVSGKRTLELVAVESTPYLNRVLERAGRGGRLEELAGDLAGFCEVNITEAAAFIRELVQNGILEADIGPAVTGGNPLDSLIEQLAGQGDDVVNPHSLVALGEVRSKLHALDAAGIGRPEAEYRAIARCLQQLPQEVSISHLFQVDLWRNTPNLTVSQQLASDVLDAVGVLHRLAGPSIDPFAKFRQAFVERYDEREAPLLEVLDPDLGIGFAKENPAASHENPLQREKLADLLVTAIRAGNEELVLTESDIAGLTSDIVSPLPDAFSAFVSLCVDANSNQEDFVLESTLGPSGAWSLGRFCDLDEGLERAVRAHLRDEEALRPDALFAEIVHLPGGRVGNILCRPVLRKYEVNYLGRSGVKEDRQIPTNDLHISIVGDRIVLRSHRLDREVIPRLSSAHDFRTSGNLPLYRFLCSLQSQQSRERVMWQWGSLACSPTLPRVRYRKAVLSCARWRMDALTRRSLCEADPVERFRVVQKFRNEWNLPRFVLLAEGDQKLPVDLENTMSIESMVSPIRKSAKAHFIEIYPQPSPSRGGAGKRSFVQDLIIPFTRRAPSTTPTGLKASPFPMRLAAPVRLRCHPPGSEWLYIKLYTGAPSNDHVLLNVVAPLVQRATGQGWIDEWHFIRYQDPHPHIRVRFHGDPHVLHSEVLQHARALGSGFLESGLLSRIQIDTYSREVERFGGLEGMKLAEQMFTVDSITALKVIALLPWNGVTGDRFLAALAGIDRLFTASGFDQKEKIAFLSGLPEESAEIRKKWSLNYRLQRTTIETLLTRGSGSESLMLAVGAALEERSIRLQSLLSKLKDYETRGRMSRSSRDLLLTFSHLFFNRVMRWPSALVERQIYDHMFRAHRSLNARPQRLTPTADL